MKKLFKVAFLFFFLLTGFSFIEDRKTLCGVWTARVYSKGVEQKTGVDTLHIKRNGKFILKQFSTVSLPGVYMGHWTVQKDSVVLLAESGGMLLIDEKGKPMAEKLKEKKTIKLSITIHSREEIYLSTDNCNYSRVSPKQ